MAEPISKRDLEFMLYEWLDVESLTERERFAEHSRDTFDAVLELAADLATKRFAPVNRLGDTKEPYVGDDGAVVLPEEIQSGIAEFIKAGLGAGSFDESLGGMQLPTVVSLAAQSWFQAANAGMSSYSFLTIGNANLIAEYGTPEQIDTWVRPMVEGRYFGTMCLSEPQAGSSLCLLYTSPSPRDRTRSRMPSSA